MPTPTSTVAERLRREIRAEMARQKITRQALADASGIALHNLDRRLNGRYEFSFGEAERVAAALGVEFDALITRTTAGAA